MTYVAVLSSVSGMDFNEYQKKAISTSLYGTSKQGVSVVTLGLVGESGEVAEKVKKWIRDKDAQVDSIFVEDLKREIGDVLWYLAVLADAFGVCFDDVAQTNLHKIQDRVVRGVLQGSGDRR